MSAIPTTCSSPLLSTVPRLATRWSKDNLFARIALSRISGREMEDRGLSTGMAPCSAGSHLPHLGTIVVASSFQQIHDTITRSRISGIDPTIVATLEKMPITMPATYIDSRDDRKPTWVFSRHPPHQPYIAANAETLDPNQNMPARSDYSAGTRMHFIA